jgi:hypothetical protein
MDGVVFAESLILRKEDFGGICLRVNVDQEHLLAGAS